MTTTARELRGHLDQVLERDPENWLAKRYVRRLDTADDPDLEAQRIVSEVQECFRILSKWAASFKESIVEFAANMARALNDASRRSSN